MFWNWRHSLWRLSHHIKLSISQLHLRWWWSLHSMRWWLLGNYYCNSRTIPRLQSYIYQTIWTNSDQACSTPNCTVEQYLIECTETSDAQCLGKVFLRPIYDWRILKWLWIITNFPQTVLHSLAQLENILLNVLQLKMLIVKVTSLIPNINSRYFSLFNTFLFHRRIFCWMFCNWRCSLWR